MFSYLNTPFIFIEYRVTNTIIHEFFTFWVTSPLSIFTISHLALVTYFSLLQRPECPL